LTAKERNFFIEDDAKAFEIFHPSSNVGKKRRKMCCLKKRWNWSRNIDRRRNAGQIFVAVKLTFSSALYLRFL
jgi:hypothetical protein